MSVSFIGADAYHRMTEYDYIIVGAGAAGCVLANRLTAGGEHRVLLLEAGGPDRSPWIQVPIGYGRTFNDPRFNWMYEARAGPGARTTARSSGRAAKCSAARAPSTPWCMCAASRETSTTGRPPGPPAGRGRRCCPTSSSSRITPAAPRRTTARADPVHVSDVSANVHPLVRCISARLRGDRYPAHARLQRRTARGRRALAGDDQGRCARLQRQCLPAAGVPGARISRSSCTRSADARAVRRPSRERRRVPAGRRAPQCAGAARGAAVWRRDQLAAAAGAVRHRRRTSACAASVSRCSSTRPPSARGCRIIWRSHTFTARACPRSTTSSHPCTARCGRRCATCSPGGGPARDERQPGGRLPAQSRRACAPEPAHLFQPGELQHHDPRHQAPPAEPGSLPRVPHVLQYLPAGEPRFGAHPLARPAGEPRDPAELAGGGRGRGATYSKARASCARSPQPPPLAAVTAAEREPGRAGACRRASCSRTFRQRAGSVFHASCTCAMGSDARAWYSMRGCACAELRALRVVDASAFPNVTSGNTQAPTIMLAEKAADLILQDSRASQA